MAAPQGQAQTPPRDCLTILGLGGDLCLEKTVSPKRGTVGERITFTVREVNLGAVPFFVPVTLVDTLPPGLRDVSVTQSVSPGGFAPFCTVSGRTVTCPPERLLLPGGVFTLTIEATPTRPGNFVNTATLPTALEVEAPFTVVAPVQDQQPQGGGAAPITQEGEQDSESGEVDQSFDVS